MAIQGAVIAELRAANAEQARLIATLQARVAELERRLGKDSSNSSKPPSSDGLGKPTRTQRRDAARAQDRRPGKQPGAPGAHLAQVAEPDEVVEHVPDRCGGCGADLAGAAVVAVEARQVFDLPRLRLAVAEHRVQRRRCGCGSTTAAAFPAHVRAAACYGPGVRALVAYLCVHQHLPVDRAAQLLSDVLGAPLATGTVASVVAEGAAGLAGFVEVVRERLAAAPVAHFDETGARVAGRLQWVHSASTASLGLFTVHPKRGKQAMDAAGVLPGFAGVAVHDGWAPYWRYQHATHALCGAHLLRELEAITEEPGQGWAAGMAELLVDAKLVGDRARAAGAARVDGDTRVRLQGRYQRLLADGQAANPPPPAAGRRRGRTRRSPAANLLARLDAHRVEVLRFLDDLRVPFDNNQAERDLRMVKLQQKISGCWRTLAGAQAFLTVRSYIATARKHGHNPLDALRRLFDGHPGCHCQRQPDAPHAVALPVMRHRNGHRRPQAPDRQSFDTLADRYDRLHDLQADPIGTWLAGALPTRGRRALDAGCGSGRHTLVLADRFEEVVGIDLSAPMIGLATARRSRPNIAYRHADLMSFADPDGFDLVLSVNTLHHLPDLDGALDHLRRLTRPAGLVVLVDCVARRPALPRWWFVGGAVRDLLVDLARRPTHARELWGLRTDPAWLDHLTGDRYLSRAAFERRYARAFPGAGAHYQPVKGFHAMLWHAPKP